MATEDAVFGYRPPSSRRFLNSSDEPDDEDALVDVDPVDDTSRTIKTTIGELKKALATLVRR